MIGSEIAAETQWNRSRVASAAHEVGRDHLQEGALPHLHAHVVPRTRGDGLRGFFWPRTRYADAAQAAEVASLISAALA